MAKILFFMRDAFPPFRADVKVLFGKYLPKLGINSDILGQLSPTYTETVTWPAGKVIIAGVEKQGILTVFMRPFFDMVAFFKHKESYDIIQVRDKTRTGLFAAIYAKWHKKPFVYWMSYPFVEDFEVIAKNRQNPSLIMKLADYVRIKASRLLFYKWVLCNADHVFVQSEAMRDWLGAKGFDTTRMTAVPMGVDIECFQRDQIIAKHDPRFEGKRVIIYVGLVSKARCSEFLLDVVTAVKAIEPDILLVLAGDGLDESEKLWIREVINERNLHEQVLLTGWLNQAEMLPYILRAEVGLSPYPRGEIWDTASPTKLIEYLALGLPAVANDIPDQQLVIDRSGAGICTSMDVNAFRDGVLKLLNDKVLHSQCAEKGPVFIQNERTYTAIAQKVAQTYQEILARHA